MLLGYAEDHTGDVYRVMHLKTQHVILSRDARWMNIMWKAYMIEQKCINHGLQIIDDTDDQRERQNRSNRVEDFAEFAERHEMVIMELGEGSTKAWLL